jgi:hypothetical protein
MGAHENLEHAEHAEHASHGGNKKIALLISVLALCLAFSETLGKSSQTAALNFQIEASNLWNFFQAKSIRRTATLVAAEQTKLELLGANLTDEQKASIARQVDEWTKTAARYRSEPEAAGGKGEGTVELARRAIEEQRLRDTALSRYHMYEFGSAAFQIGIVLASAQIITGIVILGWLSGFLGLAGVALTMLGLWMPHALDFLTHAAH